MKRERRDYSGNFIMQAGILAVAGIIVRIIGLLYRAPLTAIIGDEGNGYYSFAYNIYANILLISSYSIPSAISKIMSQKIALKEFRNAHRIFKCAFVYVAIVGGAAAGFAYFFAGLLVVDTAIPVLRIFAPTILLSGFLGVFRGYFQSHRSMVPTSISQIIEQIANAGISIGAAVLFIRRAGAGADDTTVAVRGASGSALGTGCGVLIALIFVGGIYFYNRQRIMKRVDSDDTGAQEPYLLIARDILLIVTPFILSTFIYNCSTAVNQTIFAKVEMYRHEMSSADVSTLYGIYSGKAVVLRNVPVALASAMSSAIIPTIASSWVLREVKDSRKKVARAVKVTMLVAIPCVALFLFLAKPIVQVLFPQRSSLDMAARLLMCLSITVVFYCLSTITNGVLQSIGKVSRPVIHAAAALAVQSLVLWVVLLHTGAGIYAIVIADILFAVIVCILNSFSLARSMGYRQEYMRTFILPGVCAVASGGFARLIYELVFHLTSVNILGLVAGFIFAFVIYMITMVQTRALSDEEIETLPHGYMLLHFMRKFHLILDDPKHLPGGRFSKKKTRASRKRDYDDEDEQSASPDEIDIEIKDI